MRVSLSTACYDQSYRMELRSGELLGLITRGDLLYLPTVGRIIVPHAMEPTLASLCMWLCFCMHVCVYVCARVCVDVRVRYKTLRSPARLVEWYGRIVDGCL